MTLRSRSCQVIDCNIDLVAKHKSGELSCFATTIITLFLLLQLVLCCVEAVFYVCCVCFDFLVSLPTLFPINVNKFYCMMHSSQGKFFFVFKKC